MVRILCLLLFSIVSCNQKKSLDGIWKAKWTTSPANYSGIGQNKKFEMDGIFKFDGDKLTITAMGYPNCIFNSDTIQNTQNWELEANKLILSNENKSGGIQYDIISKNEHTMTLKLMDIKIVLVRE